MAAGKLVGNFAKSLREKSKWKKKLVRPMLNRARKEREVKLSLIFDLQVNALVLKKSVSK